MRALTLWQPWATLVALGLKRIETRSWGTDYTGRLAVHAALRPPDEGLRLGRYRVRDRGLDLGGPWTPLPLGVVLGTVELQGCEEMRCLCVACMERWHGASPLLTTRVWLHAGPDAYEPEGIAQERTMGDFAIGRYAWCMDDARRIEPVPARGRQGLWSWEEEV